MRKILSLLLPLLLIAGLFTGCSEEDAEETTAPTKAAIAETTAPTEAETEPTETEVTYPEAQTNTVVYRDGDRALQMDYVFLAVSQDAPFLVKDVTLNESGVDALIQWLMTEEARAIAAEFGVEAYGEAAFHVSQEEDLYIGKIQKAARNAPAIQLAVEESIAGSGLLDALIPIFEESYGYTVEITSGSNAAVLSTARNANADLVLAEAGEGAQALVDDGYCRIPDGFDSDQLTFVSMQYLLCGPSEDPAGVADCLSVTAAFAAIADSESAFVSRGDNSAAHRLEQRFWPKDTQFGGWYISADMEMGPCLVLNDMQGGYILTDKLTWLKYFSANGII